MKKMKCYLCGHDMEKGTTKVNAGWGKYDLVIKGVEAFICPECGEKVYTSKEIDMIQELSESLSQANKNQRPDVLNVEEVADLLRVSKQTVYNMIKDGRLNAVKMKHEWRFIRQDVESVLQPDDTSVSLVARGDITDHDKRIIQERLRED
ncbi:MAG: DNA-binding domain-containing protein, excisionase family [Candidatus Frackibacter sp. T328-2]|nr:MAG: DNA-binding domain-containing protein, excisionase family [Candidatus Frackibacter sp. T328-2]